MPVVPVTATPFDRTAPVVPTVWKTPHAEEVLRKSRLVAVANGVSANSGRSSAKAVKSWSEASSAERRVVPAKIVKLPRPSWKSRPYRPLSEPSRRLVPGA